MNKESLIAENGSFDGSSWNWALVWRRPLLLQREIDLAHELQEIIELFQPKVHMEDLWCGGVDEVVMLALRRIWKTKAPRSVEGQLLTMSGFVVGKKSSRVVVTIWVATVWSLWLHQNKMVFNNGVCDVLEVVESTKYRAWKWLTAGMSHGSIPFVNWLNEPYHYFSSFL
ncbi:uncharacterized protein LOC109816240 [Cajanus cajan]|uniref:uncharacterized protein LOC109816240 n=1 Tax=Cajanus cajan TaxID=3821 RepID=UPI00098DC9C5|nr:uncharacterized protein LOC109816240 [Cajanus cajan]